MAGRVGTTIVVKGKKVRLWESYDDRGASFKAALDKVSSNAKSMRKAAEVDGKTGRSGFRKAKTPKKT